LNADAWFPAVIQQQTVSIDIVAALMHQPANTLELPVIKVGKGIFQAIILS
jgi:hypothetical protein